MIMIIAIIYIFLSDVIFDQQLKSTFRQSPPPEKIPFPPFSPPPPPPPEKIHFPLFTHLPLPPLKIEKLQDPLPPFCQIENFLGPAESGGRTLNLKRLKG